MNGPVTEAVRDNGIWDLPISRTLYDDDYYYIHLCIYIVKDDRDKNRLEH